MESSRLKSVDDTKVFIENEQNQIEIPQVLENLLVSTVLACLKQEGIGVACEINILLTDDESIREINSQFRNIDAPTDVLSFPMADIIKGKINDIGKDSDPTKGFCGGRHRDLCGNREETVRTIRAFPRKRACVPCCPRYVPLDTAMRMNRTRGK